MRYGENTVKTVKYDGTVLVGFGCKLVKVNGAERGTRTPMRFLPLAPQASASASSAISAFTYNIVPVEYARCLPSSDRHDDSVWYTGS